MKIFFVGYHNPRFLTFCEYCERAIKSLGHDLAVYDYRDWMIPGRIRDRIPALNNWDMKRINNSLIKKAKRLQPDILIVTGGWTISPETIQAIKKETNAVTVNWIADYPLLFETYMKLGPYYDFFFVSATDALERYRGAGNTNGYWLPFGCDPEIHHKANLTEAEFKKYKSDICFVGTCYKERIEALERLVDYDLALWGPGWDKLPEGSPLHKCVRGGPLQPQEWAKAYCASKIGLNIFGSQCDIPGLDSEEKESRMTNTRLYEILSCGVFQIANVRADAMRFFKDGEHICYYKDGPDLNRLVRKYLDEPEERGKIALAGQQEVHRGHTYQHRIEEMLGVLSQRGCQ